MISVDDDASVPVPVWAIFGDLVAGVSGVFVLMLVWTLGFQVDLAQSLEHETEARHREETRRVELERVLAGPLAEGRITLRDGKIGISGNVLFSLNSSQLEPSGQALLQELAVPLQRWLASRNEWLMVSGFTDDLVIHEDNYQFDDNWDLSAQRALVVTRALVGAGVPPREVFAAAFGEHQPLAPNTTEDNRARNRRVEIAPVPRSQTTPVESP